MHKRQLSLVSLLILVLSLSTDISRAQDNVETLIVQSNGDPQTLSGLYANDGNSLSVVTFLAEPLVLGGENWGDKIEPALAENGMLLMVYPVE